MRTVGITLVLSLIGCGDNTEPCPHDRYGITSECLVAQRFAARDTDELIATQPEVDRYFERFVRAVEMEPALTKASPQRYRTQKTGDIMTKNPTVIAAWTQAILATGDREFDDVIAQLGVRALNTFWTKDASGNYYFLFADPIRVMFSEEVLHAFLLTKDSWLGDPRGPLVYPGPDGQWTSPVTAARTPTRRRST